MTEWSRKNWLVTGASQGFGRAFVEAILGAGGKVAALTRSPDALADLQTSAGERLRICEVDITDQAATEAVIDQLERDFGGIDVLANNAGYGLLGGVEETSDLEARAIFEVNFFAAAALTRAVLPGMRGRRHGFIVNISSVSGVQGLPGSGYYAATKFALEGLTEALRRECRELGIGAMIVEPGPFRTGFMVASRKHTAVRIDDYTVLARRRASEASLTDDVMQDPHRGVAAILVAMQSDAPPERLPLGDWAAELVRERYKQRMDEALLWRSVAASADRPGSPPPTGDHLTPQKRVSVDAVDTEKVS